MIFISDRPLTHVNKKGRPTSQCQHCRGLRKSRATHVKCVCGDRARAAADSEMPGLDRVHSQDDTLCPCMEGLRCMCTHKKESSDVDADDGAKPNSSHHRPLPKPVIASRKSEPSVPKLRNGHHGPIHRNNNAAHECGLPYQIPRYHGSIDATDDSQVRTQNAEPNVAPTSTSILPQQISRPLLPVSTSAPSTSTLLLPKGSSPSMQSPSNVVSNGTIRQPTSESAVDVSLPPHCFDDPISDTPSTFSTTFAYEDFSNTDFMLDTLPQPQPFEDWHGWTFSQPYTEPTFAAAQTQSSSNASIKQPGLSRSSSGTVSVNADNFASTTNYNYATSSTNFAGLLEPIDPAWGFPSGCSSAPSVNDAPYVDFDLPLQAGLEMLLPYSSADLIDPMDFPGINAFIDAGGISGGDFTGLDDPMSGLVQQGEWLRDFQYVGAHGYPLDAAQESPAWP